MWICVVLGCSVIINTISTENSTAETLERIIPFSFAHNFPIACIQFILNFGENMAENEENVLSSTFGQNLPEKFLPNQRR